MHINNLIKTIMLGFIFNLVMIVGLSVAAQSDANAKENGSLRRFGAKVNITGEQSNGIYGAGGEVVVSGSSKGSARLMGAIVKFLGRVGDDLWIAGGDLTIKGDVAEHVHGWGGKIMLNSLVGGNASLMGADLHVGSSAAISKKSHLSGDKVLFEGASIGAVELEGREVVFSGRANAGLTIRAPFVKIGDGASIKGDVTIHTIGEPEISDQARIDGKVNIKSLPKWEAMRRSHEGGVVNRIALGILATLCAFLTGLLTLSLARGGVEKTIDTLVEEPLRSGLWGVGGLLIIPLLAVFLVLTVLGTPLAAALLMTVPLILLLSLTGSGFAIGEWIFNRSGETVSAMHRALSLLAGLILIVISSLVPYIGWAVLVAAVIFGAGALFLLF